MQISTDTERFVREVIEGNEYSFVFKDLVVVDVGCNIGTFSLWIYDLAKEIYAIDIAKENTDNLRQTIADNALDKIKVFNCGIAGADGGREIQPDTGDAGMGGWRLGNAGKTIEAFSVATFLAREKIDYVDILKMDVEGGEFEVIESPSFPASKINTIVGEIHGNNKELKEGFKKRFESLGYRYFDLGGHFMARRK